MTALRYLAALALPPLIICIALGIPAPRLIGWQCGDTWRPIVLLREEDEAPGMCVAVLPIVTVWSN